MLNDLEFSLESLGNFRPKLQKRIDDKLKSCECPSEKTSPEILKLNEEYRKALNISKICYDGIMDSYNELHKKMEKTYSNASQSFRKIFFERRFSCILKVEEIDYLNEFMAKNDSCLNLELDLADQEVQSWFKYLVVDNYKKNGIPCWEESKKTINERIENGKSEDKKFYEELLESLKNLEQKSNENLKIQEETFDKIKEINQKMKKVYEENCQCKKV